MIRIQKQLAVHEDCEFGHGLVTQTRTENNVIISKDYNRINAGNIPALDISGIETDIQSILDYLMATNITNFEFANENGDATIRFRVADPEDTFDAVNRGFLDNQLGNHFAAANPHNITKSQVGLSAVDNTSDINKPISSAVQDELDTKADISHSNDRANPHRVDAYQAGALPIVGGNLQGDLFIGGFEALHTGNLANTLLDILGVEYDDEGERITLKEYLNG